MLPSIVAFCEAEAIGPDDHAVVQCNAIADAAVFTNGHMRVGSEIVADGAAGVNDGVRVQNRVGTNASAVSYDDVRTDTGICSHSCGLSDNGGGMNAGSRFRRLIEERECASEIVIRIARK